jgi:hypothetical protein
MNKRGNASKGREVCESDAVSPASHKQLLCLNSLRRFRSETLLLQQSVWAKSDSVKRSISHLQMIRPNRILRFLARSASSPPSFTDIELIPSHPIRISVRNLIRPRSHHIRRNILKSAYRPLLKTRIHLPIPCGVRRTWKRSLRPVTWQIAQNQATES